MTKKEYAKITVEAETEITRLVNEGIERKNEVYTHWAYGAYLLWSSLTVGERKNEDYERLRKMIVGRMYE